MLFVPFFVSENKIGSVEVPAIDLDKSFFQFAGGFKSEFNAPFDWWTVYKEPEKTDNGVARFESDQPILLVAGPYYKLKAGNYELLLTAMSDDPDTKLTLELTVGEKVIRQESVSIQELIDENFTFQISKADSEQVMIIGLYLQNGSINLKSIGLRRY